MTNESSISHLAESQVFEVIETETIAGIAIHVVKEYDSGNNSYAVLTESKKWGKRLVNYAGNDLVGARQLAKRTVEDIQARIEKKSRRRATTPQVVTLFSLHQSIPANLTFGEASILIDAALAEKQRTRTRF